MSLGARLSGHKTESPNYGVKSLKGERVEEILEAGLDPEIVTLWRCDTKAEARSVEKVLIKALPDLTNIEHLRHRNSRRLR
jgi:hypothetical protein